MKNTLLKLTCTLALLGAVASASASQMTLNYSGYFGANSWLGADKINDNAAFTLTATFDAAPDPGAGGTAWFNATSLSILIGGTTYTGSRPGDLQIQLQDLTENSSYVVTLFTGDGPLMNSQYTGATPAFFADNPTATVFSGNDNNNFGNRSTFALDELASLETGYFLEINDIGTGTFTASLTSDTASVPEPSQIVSLLALSGLGGFGALVKLRRRK